MASEINRIRQLIIDNWNGQMWYGSNFAKSLKNLNPEQVFGLSNWHKHSIYELVMHIIYWQKFVIEMLKGNSTYSVEIDGNEDWIRDYKASDVRWNKAMAALEFNHNQLLHYFSEFPEDKLYQAVPGKPFSWYDLLHGLIHHDIYHLAQINQIKNQNKSVQNSLYIESSVT